MVQTNVDICNNVNLDPEMCLMMGEGVYLQTRVAQFKIEGRGSGPADPRVHRGFGKKMGFFKFY